MMHEVRSIPTAPRRIRLRPLLAHRWPLFFFGTLCVIVGGLTSWMLFLASGAKPSDERRLNRGPVEIVSAVVTRVEAPTVENNGTPIEWPDRIQRQAVHYSFTFRDLQLSGTCFAKVGVFHEGDPADVELLPQEPNRNRIQGTVLHIERAWLLPENWLSAVVVPGILLLLGRPGVDPAGAGGDGADGRSARARGTAGTAGRGGVVRRVAAVVEGVVRNGANGSRRSRGAS